MVLENPAIEAVQKADLLTPFLSGIQPAVPYLAALGVAAIGIVLLERRRPKQTKAQRQHAWNEERSWKDLKTIRGMVPKDNPARVFAYLRKVDPYRFEDMILSELARRGLKIIRGTSYSGDGGIDGTFYLGKQLYLIQAKRYAKYIKQEHVWAFDAICQRRKAKGLFVHTGKTPSSLRELKRQAGVVRIISGEELLQLFAGDKVSLSATTPPPPPPTPLQAARPAKDPLRDFAPSRAREGAGVPASVTAPEPAYDPRAELLHLLQDTNPAEHRAEQA